MGKEKKRKDEASKREKKEKRRARNTDTECLEDTPVKSIADLFHAAPTDPALEALFQGNVSLENG
jgi:hypothetical protein